MEIFKTLSIDTVYASTLQLLPALTFGEVLFIRYCLPLTCLVLPIRRRTRGMGWCRRSSGSDLPRSKLSSAGGCFGWLDNYCRFDKMFSRLLFGELEVRWWDVRSCWLETLHWQARSTDWRVRTWPRGDWETNWRCGRQNSEVTLGAARDTRPGSRTDQLVRELYRQEICLPALYGLYGAL